MKRWLVKIACILFPGYMSRVAYGKMVNPQVRKLRDHELEVLGTSERGVAPFEDFEIATYKWTRGPKVVLLVHGWEGQAGNFAEIIEELLSANYSVVAFDAPSHGFSSRGEASLLKFGDLTRKMILEHKPQYLVSHSFGSVAASYALKTDTSIAIEKYVLITTPNRFIYWANKISNEIGLTDNVQQRMIAMIENQVGISAADMNVSDFIVEANVNSALILHDEGDSVISINEAETVANAWPVSKLEKVKGTGHFRILRTPAVAVRIIEFLS